MTTTTPVAPAVSSPAETPATPQMPGMGATPETFTFETIKAQGVQVLETVKRLLHEGNVRRIIIKQEEHTIVEFPLTVGVVGAVIAPQLAAVGALAALVADCTVEVERTDTPAPPPAESTETPPVSPAFQPPSLN